jgi:AhpD family alkylhydroperoxidase
MSDARAGRHAMSRGRGSPDQTAFDCETGQLLTLMSQEQEPAMSDAMYPHPTRELADKRRQLASDVQAAFEAFSKAAFAEGALSAKLKQVIAVAVAHVTQCPYCIKGHTKAALRAGATEAELMEAIWVAAEMRAGGAYAHSALALATMEEASAKRTG